MAFQGKGIFGNPRGKVGKLMFYERNGKAIVQRCPTGIPSGISERLFDGRWFKEYSGELWDVLYNPWKSKWGDYDFGGDTPFENYFNYNLNLVKSEKLYNTTNLIADFSSIMQPYGLKSIVDYTNNVSLFTLVNGCVNEHGQYPLSIEIRAYNSNGGNIRRRLLSLSSVNDSFYYDLSGFFSSFGVHYVVAFLRYALNRYSEVIYIDTVESRM